MAGNTNQFQIGRRSWRRAGFTLVELLIVVMVIGILAAIALPKFSDASHIARENTLKDDMRYLRTQLVVFKAQHRDCPPGYPGGVQSAAPSSADFMAQMTGSTDDTCAVGAPSAVFRFGPYLSKMPPNPLNGFDTIMIVGNGGAMPPGGTPDNTTGWIFKPQTLEILPNSPGNSSDGTPYVDF